MSTKRLTLRRITPYAYMKGSKAASMSASEYVYSKFGVDKLRKLGWAPKDPDTELSKHIAATADGKMGLDHYVEDENGDIISIQSRFRSDVPYNDFTIRYDLPSSKSYVGAKTKCEFFHVEADVLFYATVDTPEIKDVSLITKIKKYVIVNLRIFNDLVKAGKIIPDEKISKAYMKDGVLHCNIKNNIGVDDTRLLVVPIKEILQLAPDIIIAQEGYYTGKPLVVSKYDAKSLNFVSCFKAKNDIIYENVGKDVLSKTLSLTDVKSKTKMDEYLLNKTASNLNTRHYISDELGSIASLNVRFREPSAGKYNDFTLRYDKANGTLCEFEKLHNDLFFYAICDNSPSHPEKIKKFQKWTLLDIAKIRRMLKDNKIVVDDKIKSSYIKSDVMYCPIKNNKDAEDARFITISIEQLATICPEAILEQEGFY